MKRPVIGITPSCSDDMKALSLPRTYIAAVEDAGGIALILPHTADREAAGALADLCDGFLFSGGPDTDPRLYGEAPWHSLGGVAPVRDVTDSLFFELAYKSGKPILGICRGLQIINVCMGGTLYQDLNTQFMDREIPLFDHRASSQNANNRHAVIAEPGCAAAKAYGAQEFAVNTYHHQAVKMPAPGLRVTASSPDGVIEALEGTDGRFLVLVQWHPEGMLPRCEGSRKLFGMFIDACRK